LIDIAIPNSFQKYFYGFFNGFLCMAQKGSSLASAGYLIIPLDYLMLVRYN